MNDQIIGTCSECGGPVAIPTIWMGIYPPSPRCLRCGAVAKQDYGPVIPMEPKWPRKYRNDDVHWRATQYNIDTYGNW